MRCGWECRYSPAPGRGFASRVAASALQAAGLPELVTESLDGYERCAVAWAAQPERLGALRDRLRHEVRSSPLFDTARYTRDLEAVYRGMLERAP
jgi:protein O-GlcNAc transferase